MAVTFAVALAAVIVIFLVLQSRRPRRWPPSPVTPPASARELDGMITRLAKASWPPREIAERLRLKPTSKTPPDLQGFVEATLAHVRRIAPKANPPRLTPRITIEPSSIWAGQFSEESGWVKISVSANFQDNPLAARAILCHEICHYVLGSAGIKERESTENERLTDVAMFVFGLGDIFLAGYERRPVGDYRPGHRLGYLAADEYAYVRDRVEEAWARGDLMSTAVADLQTLFKAAIPDASVRQRLLSHAQSKAPTASEAELIASVLDEYRRDQR